MRFAGFKMIFRWGAAAGLLGSSVFAFTDIQECGPVRIGRAGLTVTFIVMDYKWAAHTLRKFPVESEEYNTLLSKLHRRSALKLKKLCCKNKGTYVKVGQHLGSLDYILPAEYVETMKSLYRDAPQSAFCDLLKVLENELGMKPSAVFREIEENPLGTASLAQVHKAVLLDGTTVAVKIQHPQVEEKSHIDIAAMEVLVKSVAKVFPEFQFLWLAEETKKILPIELDFLQEGRNCEQLGRILSKKFDYAKVPDIYWQYSTKKVLVMEFCDGGRIDDLGYYQEHNISPVEVYCKICKLFSEMIFREGYLHCDPHPGNILVGKDSRGHSLITLLDHGVHQRISDRTRISYANLWLSVLQRDVKGMEKYGMELGVGDLFGLFACMLTARSWEAVIDGVDRTAIDEKEVNNVKSLIGSLIPQISQVLNRLPREVLLILKTNDLLRGLSYKLKVTGSSCSFTAISRACTRVAFYERVKNTTDPLRKCSLYVQMILTLLKIKCYQYYLWWTSGVSRVVF